MKRRGKIVLALGLGVGLGVGLPIVAGLAALALSPKPLLYEPFTFSTAVLDRNANLMRLSLAADQRYRLFTPLEDMGEPVIRATLLYEDRHFYRHPGVNPYALVRSAWATYIQRSRAMGGSTITMQLARLRFTLDTRTIAGKLRQIYRALQIERHYSKAQILEAYLNLVPYGGNIEGVGSAALIYFARSTAELSLTEALALAVIPQNPAQRNPVTPGGYARMNAARQRLRAIWHAQNPMPADQLALFELPLAVRPSAALPFIAPHIAQMMLAGSDRAAGAHQTTISPARQKLLEQTIGQYIQKRAAAGIRNASAMLVDHRSMEVLATVGSANFFDATIQGQVNGTRAKRSPGSTLKPFLYGMALDQGLIHPRSMLKDAPKRFGVYTPENFDRGFMGPVTAQDALIYSRNVPAIELLSQVGHTRFHEFLSDADVAQLKDPDYYGLAMILGGNELTMEEITRLYAVLANRGTLKALRYDYDSPRAPDGPELLSPEASFLVLDMLRNNPRPGQLGIPAEGSRIPIAWKTGTSYAFRDAWTVGVIGPYVLSVWVGNFDGAGNPALVGRQAAAPLFFDIADRLAAQLTPDESERHPAADLNLAMVEVCTGTGDLPGRHCPATEASWFIPGVSPIKVSSVHRAVRVDTHSGKRSCRFDPGSTREEVFEFWPSDLERLFQQAGISKRRPPPWEADCSLDRQAAAGAVPHITSPAPRLTYHVRAQRSELQYLPLTATTDADVSKLFWFVNDSFVGVAERNTALMWQPSAGEFDILVVDDLGRSASNRLAVTAVH